MLAEGLSDHPPVIAERPPRGALLADRRLDLSDLAGDAEMLADLARRCRMQNSPLREASRVVRDKKELAGMSVAQRRGRQELLFLLPARVLRGRNEHTL